MKSFIVGGAGFIGSHLAGELLERGPVTVYDNLCSGSLARIAHLEGRPGFSFVRGEAGDLPALRAAIRGCDLVAHLAANPDIARGLIETDLDVREGTLLAYNVLEAMRLEGVGTLLYASGSGVYGDVGATPTPENFGPLLPISMYGASKLSCEGMISAFSHLYGIRGLVLRFANVVGSRQTHGIGYDFISKLRRDPRQLEILGDGSQSKSYIHVSDVVAAMLFILDRAPGRMEVFNVATDDYLEVAEIARIVIEEMGLKGVKLNYTGGDRGWKGDVPVVRFNLDKIHNLGWQARHNSAAAIRLSIREMLGEAGAD